MIQFGKYHFSLHNRSKQKNGAKKFWVCGRICTVYNLTPRIPYAGDRPVPLRAQEGRLQVPQEEMGLLAVVQGLPRCCDNYPVFITSAKGYRTIQIGQYLFGLHTASKKADAPKKRWVCRKWSKGCRATVITVDDVIVRCNNEHNH
ncbi:FLYWCH zinc finger domain-containing protein [Phthorimaea operculella]|nr:FLYWCH zinc finger domain-containing protein [Phthorimaea operculella]